jgi:sugar lactone lactonase YvrE
MSIQLTKPLVVPEFLNALVKTYIADPNTGATIPRPPFTINLQTVVTSLFPGRTARANSCALLGYDLFISNSSSDSQCIFKVPNYLTQPEKAIAQTFVFTLDDVDYVGIAFDAAGNLYTAQDSLLNNRIVKYTGTAKPYPGAAAAAVNNYATRTDIGNAGATSYFSNLAFDAAGNLWVTDYKNHRVVVFDAAHLGGSNTYHVLNNLVGAIPVANTNTALSATTSRLFAEPEGLDFDGAGNLWVANNNDGYAGVHTLRTSLVKLTPALQLNLLSTMAGGGLTPTLLQSNDAFSIYQVPNLGNDLGARPQFGGLQVDRVAGRIFVNEQIANKGRGYDIATIAAMGTSTAANDLDIVSTNPGNSGIALVNAPIPVPAVLSATPGTGSSAGGTSVILRGTGFTATAVVTFGGQRHGCCCRFGSANDGNDSCRARYG